MDACSGLKTKSINFFLPPERGSIKLTKGELYFVDENS